MKPVVLFILFTVVTLSAINSYAQPVLEEEMEFLLYPKAQYYPKIDGIMDNIWLNVPRYVMTYYCLGTNKLEANPWYDCSAEWRVMWTDQAMYWFVQVRDDSLVKKGDDYTDETEGYRWDSIEIFNDANNSHTDTYDGVDDVQFRIHWGDLSKFIRFWTDRKGPEFDVSEVEWNEQITDVGYNVEIMFIMDELFLFPKPGMIIGSDCHYNDNDLNKGRDSKIQSFGKIELSHMRPSAFGRAVLSGWTASDTLMVVKTFSAPIIDGEMDDLWQGVPPISASQYMSNANLYNYADLAMKTRMMWDENYLYTLVKVWDDSLVRDGAGDYNDDSIELYVDADFSHGTTYDNINDIQIAFGYQPGDPALSAIHLVGSSVSTPIDFSGVLQAAKVSTDELGNTSITLELALPMTAIKLNAAPNHLFGVEMDYNDDDDGGDRDTKLKTYGKTDDTWQNPRLMIPAKLLGNNPHTSVADGEEAPLSLTLAQNYPNPFNPVTVITYSLAEPSPVKLSVYNVLGHQVQVLVNETQSAGNYAVTFNGEDLASGVYFYQLESNNQVQMKKMMLIQ
ncbi:MAG: T9SS C-terminal target domain-containing protein [Calditrichaeota bacterium]|nr:MAG: T9SS C-terminal target domain-containing protein [Calditrichota bacterium]